MADEFSQNLAALRLLKLHVGLSTKHIAVINHMINMDTYAEKNTQAKYSLACVEYVMWRHDCWSHDLYIIDYTPSPLEILLSNQ